MMQGYEPVVVRFDVSAALPHEVTQGEELWICARLFAPVAPRPTRSSVVVCLHGGSYDGRYFHITGPGLDDYSMAAHFAARGHIVLVPDQLGIGDSARPAVARRANTAVAAAANHAAMAQAFARLADGTLSPDIPPCVDPLKVGIGHSMGAMVLITEQARFGSYDLVAPIGYSNQGAHVEVDGETVPMEQVYDETTPDYQTLDRELLIPVFHWEGLPPEVMAADAAMSVDYLSVMAWEARQAQTVEVSAAIDKPIFLAYGERDVSPDPFSEPAFFRGSPDITFYRLAQTGHCHNFAPTRHQLWNRLDAWIRETGSQV